MATGFERPFSILQITSLDDTGDSYYRSRWPAMELALQRPDWLVITLDAQAEERFEWAAAADLLYLFQPHDVTMLPVLERRKAEGKVSIVECFDNFYAPPPASSAAEAWGSPLLWQAYEHFIEIADVIVVTSPGMKELLAPRALHKMHVLDNHLWSMPDSDMSDERIEGAENETTRPVVRIGWGGSLGHIADLLAVLPSVEELVAQHPNFRLHLMGNAAIPDLLQRGTGKVTFHPWGNVHEYFSFLSTLHIGFVPQLPTDYNRCRSDIKAVELAGHGVLPLLPRTLPYAEFITRTECPSYASLSDLPALIEHFANDQKERAAVVTRCKTYVKNERIGRNRHERRKLFESLLPSEPGRFPAEIKSGYHEITGTKQAQSGVQERLRALQKQVLQGGQSALDELNWLVEKNPYLGEAALFKFALGAQGKMHADAATTSAMVKRFHRDLRFGLASLESCKSANELFERWKDFLGELAEKSDVEKEFFEQAVAHAFVVHCSKAPDLTSLLPHLVQLYPQSAALRLLLAQQYERRGDYEKALEQFAWLANVRKLLVSNKQFYQTMRKGFFDSWILALQERIRLKRVRKRKDRGQSEASFSNRG